MPVDEGPKADIIVFLSYGMGNPQKVAFSYPVFGRTGGGTSTFTGSTYGSGGSSTTTGTLSSPSKLGVVGTATGTRTEYFRWVMIHAVDVDAFQSTNEFVEVWRTTATSSGSNSDLRAVFPILVAALEPYLATNTGEQKKATLTQSSPRVVQLRATKAE